MWQKCPICNGEGKVVNYVTSSMFDVCPTCNGKRILNDKTGLPPGDVVEKQEQRDMVDISQELVEVVKKALEGNSCNKNNSIS